MKKLFLLIILLLLVGCKDNHVIEVKHTDSVFTSELIGMIPGNKEDWIYISSYNKDDFR